MEFDEELINKWKEIRARVDSLINEVFLISGGALALSVTALLGLRQSCALITKVKCIAHFCLVRTHSYNYFVYISERSSHLAVL